MKKCWPYLFLTLVVFLIALLNFKSGTFLTGWDNLHPEFYFSMNIKRSLFAVWQQYQGLGLLGGMGHAADLIRQLFLLLLYPVVPQNQIRFVWTMLTLWIGTVGMYVLIKTIFSRLSSLGYRVSDRSHSVLNQSVTDKPTTEKPTSDNQQLKTDNWVISSLLGALFYLLNLAMLQTYAIPFEVFTAQFATLPWLLLTTILYLKTPTKKTLLWLALILLLSTPTGYVPTVFIVDVLAIILVAGTFFLGSLKTEHWKAEMRKIVTLSTLILIINAFWLLPFSYFTLTNTSVNVSAKINQMATENIFSQNKEFGTIPDVIMLKGFLFQSSESTPDSSVYVLAPWREHISHPFISALGYFFFIIVFIGAMYAFLQRKPASNAMLLVLLFSVTMLLTATPPFSWIDRLLRDHIPLFGQIFRFPFTKFSLLAAVTYAVFFALGIGAILNKTKNLFHQWNKRAIEQCLFLLFTTLLITFMFPLFQGKLFFSQEQLAIPKEYFQLFAFFKKQDTNTRIANFPQPSFWGWEHYNFGYAGSGFLWYGIAQPILDRAFDVWSNYSENYYYEVSQAVYTKNPILLNHVLQKYQVNWVIIDKNLRNPPSPKELFFPELEQMIVQIPQIKKVKSFGNIDIYKVSLRDNPKNFVFTAAKFSGAVFIGFALFRARETSKSDGII